MKNSYGFYDGFRTMIAGISGMGKSYWVKKVFIPMLMKLNKPIIIFDRKEEYAGRRAIDNCKSWIGYEGIYDFYAKLQKNKGFLSSRVHVIACKSDVDYNQGLRFFLALKAPVSLILDEAHDLFLDNDLHQAGKVLTKINRYGRSEGIDITLITQRSKDIPPNIRSQYEFAISFKQTHQDDIKALDERGWINAKKVLDLNRREFEILGELPSHLKIK